MIAKKIDQLDVGEIAALERYFERFIKANARLIKSETVKCLLRREFLRGVLDGKEWVLWASSLAACEAALRLTAQEAMQVGGQYDCIHLAPSFSEYKRLKSHNNFESLGDLAWIGDFLEIHVVFFYEIADVFRAQHAKALRYSAKGPGTLSQEESAGLIYRAFEEGWTRAVRREVEEIDGDDPPNWRSDQPGPGFLWGG